MNRLVIHAPNTHQGGGRTLLLALLQSLPSDVSVELVVDKRLEIPFALPAHIECRRVPPTIFHRLRAEWHLSRTAGRVLCFGNLPPLWTSPARVCLFVHNAYLVFPVDTSQFPWRQRMRIAAERRWLRGWIRNAQEFIVQTESMRLGLAKLVPDPATIRVLPFVPTDLLAAPAASNVLRSSLARPYDFCYVSTGEPHKNHRTLLHAWRLLAERGLSPSLCITLSPRQSPQLCRWIERYVSDYGLKVDNLGFVPLDRIGEVYDRSRCLVFPSRHESFGLPLLEAQRRGLKIVAPELDYVRDLVDPDECFDANSPRSLARAVERVLGGRNVHERLLDGRGFVEQLLAA